MINVLQQLELRSGASGSFHSLPLLEKKGLGTISRLPFCLRVVLESVIRNLDGKRIRDQDVERLADWQPSAPRTAEVGFVVARVLLQDFTGVPLLVDLAAMRDAVVSAANDPKRVEPLVPVDLVIDHSVQVDYAGSRDALRLNMEIEFKRNAERYRFLKWGMQAFDGFRIVPPGFGICHQVNLEYLANCVVERRGVFFPDSCVGTDSHTTMVNGLGVVGWGVGGIEAEAAMLGQPVAFLLPDVVGVHLKGRLREGVTATDLVLVVTEMLRKAKVVGKFVEFHGQGATTLAVTDRATIANMAPEYGATIGYFPVDEQTCNYLRATGRTEDLIETVRRYYTAQGMFGIPPAGACDYSTLLELDLAQVEPSISGPKRPQDRIDLTAVKRTFLDLLERTDGVGYGKTRDQIDKHVNGRIGGAPAHQTKVGGGAQDHESAPAGRTRNTSAHSEQEMMNNRPTPDRVEGVMDPELARSMPATLHHGDIVIAAITSCTNTSNPSVMLAAGLLAKKAVERGLTVPPWVKTSLAPGSRAVTDYLDKTGLSPFLDRLGFETVGYGCTTCIGNSGPLDPAIENLIQQHDLVAASVLSGNRNFEARVHQSVKANFLMSPPLVVAFALAGRVDIDVAQEPLGFVSGPDGATNTPVFLRDLWPTTEEVGALLAAATDPETYRRIYADFTSDNPMWNQIPAGTGLLYPWDSASTYIRNPPYFDPAMAATPIADLISARALAIFGDSVTTDHISPAGAIKPTSPAGTWLREQGVDAMDFNSYGARRGNHEVMVRGTFANVRIKNLMLPGVEGGVTLHQPDGARLSIYDAAQSYQKEGVPSVVFAGQEYGTGSSRDWAAKGTRLLGIRAVIARSFERIHRSNLVGMGVLPLQLPEGVSAQTLGLDGTETFDLVGFAHGLTPLQRATVVIHRTDEKQDRVEVTVRIDTPIEVEYYRSGGILPYVLGQILKSLKK